MLWIGHEMALLLRLATPEKKDHPSCLGIYKLNDRISKKLPRLSMGIRTVSPNGQRSIQHEHPLTSPSLKTTVVGHATTDITAQFEENIFQGRRESPNVGLNRKTKAVGDPWSMVGILPNQKYFHGIVTCQLKRPKNIFGWRKNRPNAPRFFS